MSDSVTPQYKQAVSRNLSPFYQIVRTLQKYNKRISMYSLGTQECEQPYSLFTSIA